MRITICLTMFAPLLVATACNAAAAATPDADQEALVRRIKTSDLDLGKAADRKTLDRRIAWAAMDVCPTNIAPSMLEMMHSATCRRKALRDSRQQVAALEAKVGSAHETVLARAELH